MALTVSVITNNGGASDVWVCKGVNDGSAAASLIRCGFVPRIIEVWNETDVIKYDYISGMNAAYAFKLNGTGPAFTEITSNGVTTDDGTNSGAVTTATGSATTGAGFILGTGILAASKTYWIKAFR